MNASLNNKAEKLSARTINAVLHADRISETTGSIAWLAARYFEVRFFQTSEDDLVFRIAEITVAGRAVVVAADGAYRSDNDPVWSPANGYHEIEVTYDSQYAPELTFGVALTPGAIRLLNRVFDEVRTAFRAWIAEEGADEVYKVSVVQGKEHQASGQPGN